MANVLMSNLAATINEDNDTRWFVESFEKAKNSTKRLVRSLGHCKVLSDTLNTDIGTEVIKAIGTNVTPFITITDNALKLYSSHVKGATRGEENAEAKTKFFVDSVFDEYRKLHHKKCKKINFNFEEDSPEIDEALKLANATKSVKALTMKLYQDKALEDGGSINDLMENVILLMIVRQLMIDGLHYSSDGTAVDENGKAVETEVIVPVAAAAHHQDKTPIIVEAAPETKTEAKVDGTPKEVDKFELMERKLKSSSTGPEFINAFKTMISDVDDSTPNDIIERTANILKPYVSTTINTVTSTDTIDEISSGLTDRQKYSAEFHKDVLTSMLPETFDDNIGGVDIKNLIKYISVTAMSGVDINDLECDKYSNAVTIYAVAANLIYGVLAAVTSNDSKDVIDYYKLLANYMDINNATSGGNTQPTDDNASIKELASHIGELTGKMERVNAAIKAADNRPYESGMYIIRGARERQAQHFISDGIKEIQKAGEEPAA